MVQLLVLEFSFGLRDFVSSSSFPTPQSIFFFIFPGGSLFIIITLKFVYVNYTIGIIC